MGASAREIEREIRQTRERMDENLTRLEGQATSRAKRYAISHDSLQVHTGRMDLHCIVATLELFVATCVFVVFEPGMLALLRGAPVQGAYSVPVLAICVADVVCTAAWIGYVYCSERVGNTFEDANAAATLRTTAQA